MVSDPVRRFTRLRAARKAGDVQRIVAALDDPPNRWLAIKYVGDLQVTSAAPVLLRLLRASEDPQVRANAAFALGQLASTEAAPVLRTTAANDEVEFVRANAVAALGRLGDPADVPLLVSRLGDESVRVRSCAVEALGGWATGRRSIRCARRGEESRSGLDCGSPAAHPARQSSHFELGTAQGTRARRSEARASPRRPRHRPGRNPSHSSGSPSVVQSAALRQNPQVRWSQRHNPFR